jgi:putative endonuclease
MNSTGCYILYSKKIEKFYIGVTLKSLDQRIDFHNTSYYGNNHFTSVTDDWELQLFIPTLNYSHAIRIERKIKSMKSKVYIQNLLKYNELVQKIYDLTLQST